MKTCYKLAFVSNYINHHQIPFCNAMNRLTGGNFTFIQTEPMEEQRVRMGWNQEDRPSYVKCFYEEEAACRRLILDCDMVVFGGTDEESYIVPRLKERKPVIRYSERLYKTGQWKAISPRGLKKKYHDHTRYRKEQVYLLCAGAYVASDFGIVRAYPGKKYCWGYFPETKHYDVDRLLAEKGYGKEKVPCLLWAARMIDWKHPELALKTAKYLKDKKLSFHMNIIGDGELYSQMEEMLERDELEDCVSLLGYKAPADVRRYMEEADIFLFTSDRQEGWGAVANEAMNSACALVADHLIGAVPFLVVNGENGFIYRDGDAKQLFALAEKLVKDRALCRSAGRKAYATIAGVWNAENAAERLMELIRGILNPEEEMVGNKAASKAVTGNLEGQLPYTPCMPAPVLGERYRRKS
ncbi:glycosyltransferase family 4 protein [Acetatifactor muris]|uniref:glycosyltransferase family 4 protein n=1 Tax=Acetatifactor muris TaxID=879566 RepID=UPI0023F0B55A|nr:glycosyltransferase family 4 protein [Acetatifactor muris]